MAGAADFVAPRPLAVTVGNYLLMYADGRFARHPRFRYFALNTEMRWLALQAGWIGVRQYPHDAQLFFFDCISTTIVTSITSTETQRACSLRLAPPMPCIRLVIMSALSSADEGHYYTATMVCILYYMATMVYYTMLCRVQCKR